MMTDDLYQEVILEYSGRKDLCRELPSPSYAERGHNANCGDDLTLLIRLDGDRVHEASYIGEGCAISKASTAMLLDLILGRSLKEAKEKIDIFFKMMKQEELSEAESEKIGDALLLRSASKLPARVKCATLSWHTMKVIIDRHEQA